MTINGSGLVVLTVVFMVLKLCGIIDWTWWWIFAPLWIPIGIVVGIFLFTGIIALVAIILDQ